MKNDDGSSSYCGYKDTTASGTNTDKGWFMCPENEFIDSFQIRHHTDWGITDMKFACSVPLEKLSGQTWFPRKTSLKQKDWKTTAAGRDVGTWGDYFHNTKKYVCGFKISDGGGSGGNMGIDGMKIKWCDIECDDGSLGAYYWYGPPNNIFYSTIDPTVGFTNLGNVNLVDQEIRAQNKIVTIQPHDKPTGTRGSKPWLYSIYPPANTQNQARFSLNDYFDLDDGQNCPFEECKIIRAPDNANILDSCDSNGFRAWDQAQAVLDIYLIDP